MLPETINWEFTNFNPAENPNGGNDEIVDDDHYHYATEFYGVDYFMDIYVTKGAITDHTCSRYLGAPLGYLYESDFEVPESIVNDIARREGSRL